MPDDEDEMKWVAKAIVDSVIKAAAHDPTYSRADAAPEIPAGSFFTVTTGEYSDYSVHGVFRALQDIDPRALSKRYLSEHPDQAKEYHFEESQFLGWLAREGVIETVDSYEWHLSNYSTIEMTVSNEISEINPAYREVDDA
jgi:hypothetical protein